MKIDFDAFISRLSILLCIILLMINITIIKNQIIFFTLIILLGFLLFYKLIMYNKNIMIADEEQNRTRICVNNRLLVTIFFIFTTLELLFIYFNGYSSRGYILFIMYSVQVLTIGLQITDNNTDKSTKLIILQAILLGLLIRIPIGLSVPSVIGVDPWYHEGLTYQIYMDGLIPSDTSYTGLPIFHLLMVEGMSTLGVNYAQTSYLIGSTFQVVIIATFSYLLGKRFITNQIGLMAALIGMFANTSVLFGIAIIPNTIGAVLWLPILFLLFAKRNIMIRAIIILLVLVLVLTHSLSAMGLFVVLLILLFSSMIMGKITLEKYKYPSNKMLGVIPAILGALMFACWTYFSFNIYQLASLIKIGFNADISYQFRNEFIPFAVQATPFQEFIGNIGRILFFALALVAVLYIIRLRNKYYEISIFSVAAISPLALGYFTYFSGMNIISGRWWYFSQILSTIIISPFIIAIAKSISNNKRKIIATLMISVLCFTMLIGSDVNFDNNETGGNTASRLFLNEGEICSYKYVQQNINLLVAVDENYGTAFHPIRDIKGATVRSIAYDLLISQEKPSGAIWVLRLEMKQHPILLSTLECPVEFDAIAYAQADPNISKIYDCGDVFVFK